MKSTFLKFSLILFTILLSTVSAEDLQKYRMIDLGVFGTDQSDVISINEKGQVLGTFREGENDFIFLWDEINGLKIIEMPDGCRSWQLKLNNIGQIAGVSYSESSSRMFYWDPNFGLWELESSKKDIDIVAFNDRGQVLGNVEDQIYLWDHGKKINLSAFFREHVPGNWTSLRAVDLNNHGHVAFNVYKSNSTQYDPGFRSFLWKGGPFEALIPEDEWETLVRVKCVDKAVNVVCMDDNGNMILTLFSAGNGSYGHLQYFISPSSNIYASCQGCDLIRNGFPIARYCLPAKQKKDRQGKFYFTQGVEIKKLFKEEFPYYNISSTADVRDQNSKGYVIGTIGTMYSGHHAFLAIPENQIENNNLANDPLKESLGDVIQEIADINPNSEERGKAHIDSNA